MLFGHEQQAVRMAVAAATHHSYDRSSAHACTQTDLEYVTPAPVIECVAPAPAVTFVVPSQQLPPVFTTTTVTTDDLEEFTAPVCNQVHQELIAASEMTENFAEIPVVQEQVTVQDAVYSTSVHRARSCRVRGTCTCGSSSRPLLPCTRHLHLWRSSSRPLLPCTRHLRLLWSTSRLLQPCTRHQRQWWSFYPCLQLSKRQRQQWSTLHPCPLCSKRPRQQWRMLHPCPLCVQALTSAVENIAPAPGVQAPTLVVGNIAPAPAVLLAPAPVVKSFSHVPAVSRSPAPGQSSTSRRGHDLPLPSGWRCAEDASGRVYYWHVHTRQTRWTPPVSVDVDEDVEDEEYEEEEDDEEEVEDDGMDEIYAESRFPAGFLPMRMCRWFPLRELPAGMGCMFAHSVSELHPQARGQGP